MLRHLVLIGFMLFVLATLVALPAPPAKPDPAEAPKALAFPPRSGTCLVLPVEAIDGDTVRFFWVIEDVARLNGINAPELHGDSAAAGQAAKRHLVGMLPACPIKAVVHGREKYGRALLDLYDADGQSLAARMIEAGHAKPWDGKGPRP